MIKNKILPALCDLDLADMILIQGYDIQWNVLQIPEHVKTWWPEQDAVFPTCMHCDLRLADMTFVQGYNTPLGPGH